MLPQLIPAKRALAVVKPSACFGIVVEAESFEWHGKSAALTRDCARYNAFTVRGWVVIRFSWYQVMFEGDYVLRVLEEVVGLVRRHANVARGSPAMAA